MEHLHYFVNNRGQIIGVSIFPHGTSKAIFKLGIQKQAIGKTRKEVMISGFYGVLFRLYDAIMELFNNQKCQKKMNGKQNNGVNKKARDLIRFINEGQYIGLPIHSAYDERYYQCLIEEAIMNFVFEEN